jgi:hypothetical protein
MASDGVRSEGRRQDSALGRALQLSDMRRCPRLAVPPRDDQPETERAAHAGLSAGPWPLIGSVID